MGKIIIGIDAGHGSDTAGKRTPPMKIDIDFEKDGKMDVKKGESIREHQAAIGVAEKLSAALERCGFGVYESAFGKVDVPLQTRQKNIKNAKCLLSVSIHFNASGDGKCFNSGNGIEIWIHNNSGSVKKSKSLAEKVLTELLKGTEQKNRGIKSNAFAMCNCSVMGTEASILVECGFMTNEREAKLMGSSTFWEECAEEICAGICKFTGRNYITPFRQQEDACYIVTRELKGYLTAADAKTGENQRSTLGVGNYYIYKEYDNMLNISKVKGKAGAWINPSKN